MGAVSQMQSQRPKASQRRIRMGLIQVVLKVTIGVTQKPRAAPQPRAGRTLQAWQWGVAAAMGARAAMAAPRHTGPALPLAGHRAKAGQAARAVEKARACCRPVT